MFDHFSPYGWIDAMKNFSDNEVEFYMWGGEPFCIDETFDLVKGFAGYDFVKWARIDTNLVFTKKIIKRCSSEKIKLLCSWHTETLDFRQLWDRIMLLKNQNMIGMINFVASDSNMKFLKLNHLNVETLIRKFSDEGLFFNIAADFAKGDDPTYKEFITKYMTIEDWDYIHGHYPSKGVLCDAGETFFDVSPDGSLTSCGIAKRNHLIFGKYLPVKIGNFTTGKIMQTESSCPKYKCLSIISYCHRKDNDFSSQRHLEDYIKRNILHRNQTMNLDY